MNVRRVFARPLGCGVVAASLSFLTAFGARTEAAPFLPVIANSSTIPANGDLNPYGVAFVPKGFPSGGVISAGDVLVANFNNSGNTQGTGSTIVQFTPGGVPASPTNAVVFFTSGPQQPGLSTALGVLRGGFVVVGNTPTPNGSFSTLGAGALQVIDRHGTLVRTFTDSTATFIDGPWDLTIDDEGSVAHIFVSNVENGTVSRLDVAVSSTDVTMMKMTTIAMNYSVAPNQGAVILGPTGLAYDESTDTLYVASTNDNAIYAVANAEQATTAVNKGALVFSDPHLLGPLALRFAPNGNLITANGDAVNTDPTHPSELVEFTKEGQFVREYNVDGNTGGAFGFDTVRSEDARFNFAVIDDNSNSLTVYRLPTD